MFPRLTILLFLLPLLLPAQKPVLEEAERLMIEADTLYNRENFQASADAFLTARDLFLQAQQFDRYVIAFTHLARVYQTTGETELQSEMIRMAMQEGKRLLPPEHPAIGIAHVLQGEQEFMQGRLEEAKGHFEQAIERLEGSDRHEDLTWAHVDLGMYHWVQQEYAAMEAELERATLAAQSLPQEHVGHAIVLDLFGMLYDQLGDYHRAIEVSEKSLALQLQKRRKSRLDILSLANTYGNIGAIHISISDHARAIDYLQKSAAVYRSLPDPPRTDLGRCLNNLALEFKFDGKWPRAHATYREALALLKNPQTKEAAKEYYLALINLTSLWTEEREWENAAEQLDLAYKVLEKWKLQPEMAYYYSGRLDHARKDFPSAIKAYKRSLQEVQGLFEAPNVGLGVKYLAIGQAFMEMGAYDSALVYLQTAIQNYTYGFHSDHIADNPSPNSEFTGWRILECLRDKGKALQALARSAPQAGHLEMAHATYLLAAKVIQTYRKGYKDSGSRLILSENALPIYEGAITTALDLFAATGDEKYAVIAFGFAERSQGLALMEGRWEVEARSQEGLPGDLGGRRQGIQRDLAFYQGKILAERQSGEKADSIKLSHWEGMVFDLKRELEAWEAEVIRHRPNYLSAKHKAFELAPNALSDPKLASEEALIEFFIGQKELFTFCLSQKGLKTYRTPLPSNLEEQIATFLRCTGDFSFVHDSAAASYQSYISVAHELHALLLAPALADLEAQGISQLIIVPNGSLHQIPFEALLTQPVTQAKVNFLSLPYLIRTCQIRYANSYGLLLNHPPQIEDFKGCLAFAPAYSKAAPSVTRGELGILRSGPAQLRGAQGEVQALAELGLSGKFLFGEDATEAHFKSLAPEYSLIHLALHGQTDSEEPLSSRILFSSTPEDSCEDGILHAYELPALSLQTDLLVLSACESGIGKFRPGEGVMSLGRNFMAAGVRMVVMTLWQVEDQASSKLITLFYEHIAAGIPTAEALHRAKIEFLENADSRLAHPFYWAGYVSYGEERALGVAGGENEGWMFLGIGIFAIATVGFWIWRRMASNSAA